MKRAHAFLAVRLGGPEARALEDRKAVAFDMLRYDRCYPIPVGGLPDNWLALKQPWQEGIRPGFTFARWESFGFRHFVYAEGTDHPPFTFAEQVGAAERMAQAGAREFQLYGGVK
jgi:hypothetical protein